MKKVYLNREIHVHSDVIKKTETYKGLTFVRKKMVRSWTNCQAIEHDIDVIMAIGFDKWQQQTNTSYTNTEIIKELIDKNTLK